MSTADLPLLPFSVMNVLTVFIYFLRFVLCLLILTTLALSNGYFLVIRPKNSWRMECRLQLCPFTRSLWLGYKALKCLYISRKASHLQELRFLFDVLHLFSLQKSLSLNVNSHCCLWLINSPWARGGGQAHLGRRCLTVIFLKAYVSDEQVNLKPAALRLYLRSRWVWGH